MPEGLLGGFVSALSPANLAFVFWGCLLGTIVGMLPGLGMGATAALLLPLTLDLPPVSGIIMLAGICFGAMYGASTANILLDAPGAAALVPAWLDGFQMTRQGRARQALAIAAMGSFLASTAGVIAVSYVGPFLSRFALRFGPPEYLGLLFMSLTLLVSLSGSSARKGLLAGLAGMSLAAMGAYPAGGVARLPYGVTELIASLHVIPVLMGVFGLAGVLMSADEGIGQVYAGKLGRLLPGGIELCRGLAASVRGTLIGFVLGLLPGIQSSVGTLSAYESEKRLSRRSERFGTGVMEGVAAPEAANSAMAQASFIPLLALGIPTGPAPAVILAALIMHGRQPGPALFVQQAEFAWTVVAAMFVGNVMLLVLNVPLVGLWARLGLVPHRLLATAVIGVSLVGAYSVRGQMFDVWVMVAFGALGYLMRKRDWPATPLILGFMLGPMTERVLRETVQLSGGSLAIFVARPIAATLIGTGLAAFALLAWQRSRPKAI